MLKPKRFVVKKFVMARTISEAIRLEKAVTPDECWLDPDWIKMEDQKETQIGFRDKRK